MIHELKILPEYFDAVNCGKKNFEIRLNDRNYQKDDELILREWGYTMLSEMRKEVRHESVLQILQSYVLR